MADPTRLPLVVVGHASRDLVDDDARGWRLGGGVSFVSLTAARLGLPVRAVVGTDGDGAVSSELGLLRDAGVEVHAVVLPAAPVFRNVETKAGRRQRCLAAGRPLRPDDVPLAWRDAGAWALVPILGEVAGPVWAAVPPQAAVVALGWQGLLREARAGGATVPRPPAADPLLERADLTVVSRDDFGGAVADEPGAADAGAAARLLPLFPRRGQELVVTAARLGGSLLTRSARGWDVRTYGAVPVDPERDLTGAGDVFLAAYLASALDGSLVPPDRRGEGSVIRLHLAALAAALSIRGPGITAIPTRAEVLEHLAGPSG
jgi:sugar/nucleoside kinase (ribokinase family)